MKKRSIMEEKSEKIRVEAIQLLSMVKMRFEEDDDAYRRFLDVLIKFRSGEKEKNETLSEIAKLFENHPDLLHKFERFFSVSNKNNKSANNVEGFGVVISSSAGFASSDHHHDGDQDGLGGVYKRGLVFFDKVRKGFCDSADYVKILNHFHSYSSGVIERSEFYSAVAILLRRSSSPGLVHEFDDFLERTENVTGLLAGEEKSRNRKKRKRSPCGQEKSSESDERKKHEREGAKVNNCQQRCTPSYTTLPENGRTKLEEEVLNDRLACNAPEGVVFCSKRRRRSRSEEIKDEYEDERYEFDVVLECMKSTIKCAKKLLDSIHSDEITKIPIRLEDHFNTMNIRCIERVYRDHGTDLLNILRRKPASALPSILRRLEQKKEEGIQATESLRPIPRI